MALAQQIYVGALFVTCLAILFNTRADLKRVWQFILTIEPLKRTAAVLLVNWTILTAFVLTTRVFDPWWMFILIDAPSAAIVMHQPAGKPQSVVGGLYMAQIVTHGVYGALKLSGEQPSQDSYWQVLIAIAFVQLILVGGWAIGYHGRRVIRHIRLRRDPAVARQKSRKGLAR